MEPYEMVLTVIVIIFWSIIIFYLVMYSSKKEVKQEVKHYENQDEQRDEVLNYMLEKIHEYPNDKKFNYEHHYHDGLYGWLKHDFKELRHESGTDGSRPDLTLGEKYIAVEVKGPTTSKELENVYYIKCNKYSKVYRHIVVVLFHPDVSDKKMIWFYREMKRDYPDVEIIIKN